MAASPTDTSTIRIAYSHQIKSFTIDIYSPQTGETMTFNESSSEVTKSGTDPHCWYYITFEGRADETFTIVSDGFVTYTGEMGGSFEAMVRLRPRILYCYDPHDDTGNVTSIYLMDNPPVARMSIAYFQDGRIKDDNGWNVVEVPNDNGYAEIIGNQIQTVDNDTITITGYFSK